MSQAKHFKKGFERLSERLSSGVIIDQLECKNKGLTPMINNFMKNRAALKQTRQAFLDFNKKQFLDHARFMYEDVYTSYHRKDKVELMKILTGPLYDVFVKSLKDGSPLPFTLYKNLLEINMVQARVYTPPADSPNADHIWYQITMQYTFDDPETEKEVIKHNIFERREVDTSAKDWRICYIE